MIQVRPDPSMRLQLPNAELPAIEPRGPSDGTVSFGERLARSLESVEDIARHGDEQSEKMVTGEVDIHEAMIAMEKADLVLKLGSTVRNKLLDAYRQLSQG